jgi:uncharacterized protein DUF1559
MQRRWIIFAWSAGACVILLSAVVYFLIERELELRTESRNNLKQIVLAMGTYETIYQHFPQGTVPNEHLKPEQRFGWQASLLFCLEAVTLQMQLDFNKAWDDPVNVPIVVTELRVFTNPGIKPVKSGSYPVSHYIGLAGLGADGPVLPAHNPRAGCFAYDRATTIKDIKDGLANTAMVSEASQDFGPWAAGGHGTIRPLTAKPCINGPDGIGGPYRGGCFVGFADTSVRFISEKIDPTVIQAMMTINGGEAVESPKGE